MATFAEYSSNNMASHNADFPLYPYNDVWIDQTFQHQSDQQYPNATTFDAYQTYPAYSQSDRYSYAQDPAFHIKSHAQHYDARDSPARSVARSFDVPQPPVLSSTSDSGASAPSTISSAMGSPSIPPQTVNSWAQQHNMGLLPDIVHPDALSQDMFASTGFDLEPIPVTEKGCVDPALIQPFSPTQYSGNQLPEAQPVQSPHAMMFAHAPSSAPSKVPAPSPRQVSGKISTSTSPYIRTQSWQPYPTSNTSRRQSISSEHSRHSGSSEDSNKGLCPIATCGRHVKDLKAHMLTHQNERPEKCPIPTCEYYTKGFARKYDKNRHTLTHYKGTMVCGFCPGSGSAAEKSFNRADVFKRHLTSVHGVEQTPPNARRKSPGAGGSARKGFGREVSGMCSTCGVTFASAQDFYEHLDDCVLRVVQQADPAEAVNEKLLGSIAQDRVVQETMEKHMLPTTIDMTASTSYDQDEEGEDEDEDEEDTKDGTYGSRKAGRPSLRIRKSNTSGPITGSHVHNGAVSKPGKKGLTLSKNGVPLAGPPTAAGKGSKRRKNYPLSWGAAPEAMKMKKRVLCVFDGPRRLWKDDMMLADDHEVRIPLQGLGDGRQWVTDLDVETLRRAEGVLGATEEEKGPWVGDDGELERLLR